MLKNNMTTVRIVLRIMALDMSVFLLLLVVDPAFLAQPLDDGEDQDNGEQRPGNRGSVAHFVIAEGVLVNEQR
ncbi:hypothetical protein D3C76_1490220 [compost metagenome]